MRLWAEWELRYLRDHWPDMTDTQISEKLGRTEAAIKTKRYALGIKVDPTQWTAQDDAYIREHWRDQTDEETGKALNRAPHAVYQRGVSLGLHRHGSPEIGRKKWTAEETEYLQDNWGVMTVQGIANGLNRSVNAVITRKNLLGLGRYTEGGDYVTVNQLIQALFGHTSNTYMLTSWVKNRGFPLHYKRIQERRVRIVYIDEFWKWAEKNRSFIDFSRMEPLALGKEPVWLREQRKMDFRSCALQRKDLWTADEDSRLITLLKQHRYGYAELSEMLQRSCGAIQRRVCDLGLKERPVKADNHGKDARWSEEQLRILADGIRSGASYMAIGKQVGKSEKAIRGKVYLTYFTENPDKVRSFMGNGRFGDGAPVPTVRQGVCASPTRSAVKKDLSILDALLRYRLNKLGYDPFWQRFMCVHWDDIGGCTAGGTDCDSCAAFQRIRPQYCIRCGGTFYERKENKLCKSCRAARKKSYLRKMAVLASRRGG